MRFSWNFLLNILENGDSYKRSLGCILFKYFQNNRILKSWDYTPSHLSALNAYPIPGEGGRLKGWTYRYVEHFYSVAACFWAPVRKLFGVSTPLPRTRVNFYRKNLKIVKNEKKTKTKTKPKQIKNVLGRLGSCGRSGEGKLWGGGGWFKFDNYFHLRENMKMFYIWYDYVSFHENNFSICTNIPSIRSVLFSLYKSFHKFLSSILFSNVTVFSYIISSNLMQFTFCAVSKILPECGHQ